MRPSWARALCTGLVILVAGRAAANLISAGSFEDSMGNFDDTGWVRSGNQGGSTFFPAADGFWVMNFNGGNLPPDGMISQTIATVPGTDYELAFAFATATEGDGGVVHTLNVAVQGAGTLFSESVQDAASGPPSYQHLAFQFTADSASTTVTFSDDADNDTIAVDLLLDDVSVLEVLPPTTTSTSTTVTTSSSTSSTSSTVTTTSSTSTTTTTVAKTSTTTSSSTVTTTTVTTTTTTSSTATITSSTTATSTSTSTTTTTVPVSTAFPAAKRLLVKQKKSGAQRLLLVAKSDAIGVDPAAEPACQIAGELVIEAAGGASVPLVLDAGLWKPIKKTRPEVGCKYRKGPVVATVVLKAGKRLKVIAKSSTAIVPLGSDPRPVRVSVRHGVVQHCFEFTDATPGRYKADKKLVVRGAPEGRVCPGGPGGS